MRYSKKHVLSVKTYKAKKKDLVRSIGNIRDVFDQNQDSIAMEISEPCRSMFMLNKIKSSFERDDVSILDYNCYGDPVVFSLKFGAGAIWLAPANICRSDLCEKINKGREVENKMFSRTEQNNNENPLAKKVNSELKVSISLSGIDQEKRYKLNDPVDMKVNGEIKDITLRLFLRFLVMQASSTKDYEYVNIHDLTRKPCKGAPKSIPLKHLFIKDGKVVGAMHKVFQRCVDPVVEVLKNGQESYIDRIGDNKFKIKDISLSSEMLGEMQNFKFDASSGIDAEEFKTFINELFPKGE